MRAVVIRGAFLLCLMPIACAGESVVEGDGEWHGTITTEGDVTTVVNESGSVWGGTATLVEEASIGVAEGEEAYMFADILSLAASGDRIYVLEMTPPVVRVYDLDGTHMMNIGSRGQGPGEFEHPMSLALSPGGQVYVRDDGAARITVFSAVGDLIETWPLPGWSMTSQQTVIAKDGTVYTPRVIRDESAPRERRIEMVPYGPEGPTGDPIPEPEFDYEPPRLRESTGTTRDGSRLTVMPMVPFAARPVAVLAPTGAMVAGVGTAYRFEIEESDGHRTGVERAVDPVPIGREEASWRRKSLTNRMRRRDPGWAWGGPDVPEHKPFFEQLVPDQDGRIWVSRRGPSFRIPECDEDPEPGASDRPCWESNWIQEVFGPDGRYLGDVRFPPDYSRFGDLYIRDDMVLLQTMDEAGTIMVKRFRLVLPGEE